MPIFVPHLGCPHDCVFCNQKRISGVVDPLKEAELHNEIEQILSTLDYANNPRVEIAFFGGSFTGLSVEEQEYYLGIGHEYIKSGRVHALRLSTRPDYIDEETLERLKAYGVEVIELGVQSMHEDVLIASNRGHTVDDVIKAVQLIKSQDFTLGIQVMPGLPGDSVQRFEETVDIVVALKPDVIRLYPTLVIEETALADAYRASTYVPMTTEEAVVACAYALTKCLENDIQVIRIGLQPSETVSETGDVLAGPFHPSFRQLVEGRYFLDLIEKALANNSDDYSGKSLILSCHPKQVSSVSGIKKVNKEAIKKKYGFDKIKIVGQRSQLFFTIGIEVF